MYYSGNHWHGEILARGVLEDAGTGRYCRENQDIIRFIRDIIL
jgi:hypothetical protein